MSSIFDQTLAVTLPVFAMLFLGWGLRQRGMLEDAFIGSASQLVFKACLPALIFLGILRADLSTALQPALLGYFLVATLASFALVWLWALRASPQADRGVYVQGAFRGNCGIVGLALAASLYGDFGLSLGGVLLGLVILSYNLLSVVVLELYSNRQRSDWRGILKGVVSNPLILSVLLAIPFAAFGIGLPRWVETAIGYFGQMTLPLALLCIGASLNRESLRASSAQAISASLFKLLWLPLLSTVGAWLCGFSGRELGILFLYFASPTAAASFVMARAVGSNHELAAAIIALTTLGAVVSVNAGLLLLTAIGWI